MLNVSRKKVTKLNADRTPHESFKHNNIVLILRFGKLAAIWERRVIYNLHMALLTPDLETTGKANVVGNVTKLSFYNAEAL